MIFKDSLTIRAVTRVNHYQTYRWCCVEGRRDCESWCEECRYSDTEYRTHEVNLEDTQRAYQYWTIIQPQIKAIDQYHNTMAILLNISNFDIFSLEFENSSFRQFNNYYDVNVSLEPYAAFTLNAKKFIKREQNNL